MTLDLSADTTARPATATPAAPPGLPRAARNALFATRLLLGFVFLWAFADKLFGLGFATPHASAWVLGASPTRGYLAHLEGATAGWFGALAGQAWVDVLFMAGLLAAGVALVLGVALRPAAIGITVLMGALYLSALPLETNPLVDEHLVYIAVAWVLATTAAWQPLSLGRRLRRGARA